MKKIRWHEIDLLFLASKNMEVQGRLTWNIFHCAHVEKNAHFSSFIHDDGLRVTLKKWHLAQPFFSHNLYAVMQKEATEWLMMMITELRYRGNEQSFWYEKYVIFCYSAFYLFCMVFSVLSVILRIVVLLKTSVFTHHNQLWNWKSQFFCLNSQFFCWNSQFFLLEISIFLLKFSIFLLKFSIFLLHFSNFLSVSILYFLI